MSAIFLVKRFPDAENEQGTPATATAPYPGQQFAQMGRRGAIGGSPAKSIEDFLQFVATGNDDADADDAQIEQKAKIVQIAIEKGILVIPFYFESDAIPEAIDLVGRRIEAFPVDDDFGIECLLDPTALAESAIERFRDFGLSPPADDDPALFQAEITQHFAKIVPLLGKILFQNGTGVFPLMDFVMGMDEFGQKIEAHARILTVRPHRGHHPTAPMSPMTGFGGVQRSAI
jgi:hypothetical protein